MFAVQDHLINTTTTSPSLVLELQRRGRIGGGGAGATSTASLHCDRASSAARCSSKALVDGVEFALTPAPQQIVGMRLHAVRVGGQRVGAQLLLHLVVGLGQAVGALRCRRRRCCGQSAHSRRCCSTAAASAAAQSRPRGKDSGWKQHACGCGAADACCSIAGDGGEEDERFNKQERKLSPLLGKGCEQAKSQISRKVGWCEQAKWALGFAFLDLSCFKKDLSAIKRSHRE